MTDDVKVKIGLEIHMPLKTGQKLFCECPTNYYETEEPNTNTCPVCTGMPGAKPFPLNEDAIETAVMVAEMLNCKIVTENVFVKRKHYDYPDLPSGYQRTSEPVGRDGNLSGVGIWEVHLEEDPGRYNLQTGEVDYNRSGVPLIEIVTAPDMKSPEEARNFLREIVNLLKYTGRVMEVGGVMRNDVNISIEGGARVEIKNINSVKGTFKAIQFEIMRQKGMMKRGVVVRQETRGFDEKSLITTAMRVKETAADYRYIPDPDIPPQQFEDEFIAGIELPETPQSRRERFVKQHRIPINFAQTLVKDKDIADLFEETAKYIDPTLAAKWICREVLRQLNYHGKELNETKITAGFMIGLLNFMSEWGKTDVKTTEEVGKELIQRMVETGERAPLIDNETINKIKRLDNIDEKIKEYQKVLSTVIVKEDRKRISDESEVYRITHEVMRDNSGTVVDVIEGKPEAKNYLMGQVMKSTRGAADPSLVNLTMTSTLNELKEAVPESMESVASPSGAITPDIVKAFIKKKLEERK